GQANQTGHSQLRCAGIDPVTMWVLHTGVMNAAPTADRGMAPSKKVTRTPAFAIRGDPIRRG
ncbi:MAG TPA: hypothetical protein VFA10_17520, partial [Ktedonobacteraceae bacterium]|nr:hypothetical protein [Ktedonobacteraceae bacterium]